MKNRSILDYCLSTQLGEYIIRRDPYIDNSGVVREITQSVRGTRLGMCPSRKTMYLH